ncbi:[acyl-carrier-protein] S-malonyltransferase [Xylanibacillus composti]|uniref:[acyl-carrier-protein] S-malonyltransferase n=1 Tax=Xylanibacillus composti TaxID=1572762 RepID=A0A8J4M257_9BACL|nr:ACP S-malonyltransferase [Xylanibacillus composti]MDT9726954.1 [acyl-carrier-protein] S-malonyltransferase [Xylanibacillus composti]GIQ69510.1 hypothetical protein XYCOK13_23340 [Xylanibacillus composti]
MNRLAWLFPGQGSQYPGMGKELCEQFSSAREVFEEADDVLGYALGKLCFDGTAEQLRQTAVTQPAILTASIAALRVYREEVGTEPAFAAGHSLGEYSALVSAGVLSFADALRVVERRGALMQQTAAAGVGAMCAVIHSTPEAIEQVCMEISSPDCCVVISNYNAPDQTVISGHRAAVEQAAERLRELGARTAALPVSAPFHSPLMAAAAEELLEVLQACTVHDPNWPVLANVHGKPYGSKEEIVPLLAKQMTAPVRWDLTMAYLADQSVAAAIEFGPRTVLTNLMKANCAHIVCMPLERGDQLSPLREALGQAGVSMTNAASHTAASRQEAASAPASCDNSLASANGGTSLVIRCLAAAVTTRNRNWDEQQYRIGVLDPYRRLEELQNRLDETGDPPALEQMKEALCLLALIMFTKQVPVSEQQERLTEILSAAGEHAESLRVVYREAIERKAGGEAIDTVIDQGQSLEI